MRLSNYYLPTLREVPADAEIASHKLMLRAAMIRRSASGIYAYLPLGLKVIQKVEKIVREEMNRAGALEILMSAIQPKEIWEDSGRWDVYGPEMFKLEDRHGRDFCLGPTAEEYFTHLIKGEVRSYKDLPLNIYQIQNKYRDEKRPRFGINRAREFSMKDAYSFDVDQEAMKVAYEKMHQAYIRIFDRLCLDYRIVEGDSGSMGGKASNEFVALAETGEGVVVYTENGSYASTDENAKVAYVLPQAQDQKDLEKVHTPGVTTIKDLSHFLSVEEARCAKAVDLLVEGKPVLVFIPGDRELNLVKLMSFLDVPEHAIEMMDDETILSLGSHPGYTGPIGLDQDQVQVIVDKSLTQIDNLVLGANEADYHMINAAYGRDFTGQVAEDLLLVKEGDLSPEGEALLFARGVEVGHIFQLGTKYSSALNATFLDENGKEQHFWMGSYGVGVTRTVAAIIEQNYDDMGIIWPMPVAPFEAIITIVNTKKEDQNDLAFEIYRQLEEAGIEVLIDDRPERAGVKFNDRDLIGIPLRITVGKQAGGGIVEYSSRKEGENVDMAYEEALAHIIKEVKAQRK
ncbi:MAG: proline--tRNA ligase [Tissierellia bacterium]|nr:proline--tRNA ligase [Tissierellia bacterium]